MQTLKRLRIVVLVLVLTVLPGALLAGCHGDFGWGRASGSLGRQGHSRWHQAQ